MVQFGFRQAALVRHQQAENGVGEPDRAVAGDRHVIGRIQPLAFEMRDDRFGLAVAIGAADAAPPVFAMHEVAVRLERVAVHEIGAVDGDGHLAVRVPGEQPPVRHVRPEQPVARRFPDRSLAVQRALVEAEQLGVGRQHVCQPRIVDLHALKFGDWLGWAGAPKQAARQQRGVDVHCGRSCPDVAIC